MNFASSGLAGLAGLLFGLGLIASGMTNPAKVQGFLNLIGPWDPSLALVMGGAIAVAAPVFAWIERRGRTLGGETLALPARTGITRELVLGGLLFGLGWGLAGYCPGPALVAMSSGSLQALGFVAAMLVGMALVDTVQRLRA
jgi:uncharacterized membrane protein YedE/YeeE